MSAILVVEDDPSVSRLIALVLQSEGHEVRTARDGLDGIQKVKQQEPDLILLDLSMPTIDGRTFVSLARRMGCESRVVIVSAHNAEAAAEELHVDGCVCKPFDPEDLVREVGRVMDDTRSGGASASRASMPWAAA